MTYWNSCRATKKHTRAALVAFDLVEQCADETNLEAEDIDKMDEHDLYEWLEVGWGFEWNEETGEWQ